MRWRRKGAPTRDAGSELRRRLDTAEGYAQQLTAAGSRCDRNQGQSRFCHWRAEQLASEFEGVPEVVVRCTIHAGGRYADYTARRHWSEFAEG